MNVKNRTLFCHDNLEVLQGMNSESVDLIYLDPPFNKNKKFTGVLSKSKEKKKVGFDDIFRKESVKDEWMESIKQDYDGLYKFLTNIKEISNIVSDRKNKHYLYNYCYLTYMAMRLLEMRRILKNTGIIYLHCDPKMSHYLKILMDIIFGEKNFRNEIVWHYQTGGVPRKDFARKHDIIFRYVKNEASNYCFNAKDVLEKRSEGALKRMNSGDENTSRIDSDYKHPSDVFKIPAINSMAKERVGWPTQKPLPLLDRIIKASSKEGDWVLDPFCGCATTCIAAELLKRRWIGIDRDAEAYRLVTERALEDIPSDLFDIRNINSEIKPPKRTDLGKDYRLKKYVYVISNPAFEGGYKVGIAKDIKTRLNSYQTSDPKRGYKIEFQLWTPYFQEIEKATHEKFNYALEWVRGDLQEIIDFVKMISK